MSRAALPKWRGRLAVERTFIDEYEELSDEALSRLAESTDPLSSNHDTVLSVDWPHFCSFATDACGGKRGWCYTFAGFHVTPAQARKVALNDVLARRVPAAFAERVAHCVREHVRRQRLPYENLRFSGSGEITVAHVPALQAIAVRGVRLWGFTKNPHVAEALTSMDIAVLFSCDHTTNPAHIERVRAFGLPIAYSSKGIEDVPPPGTLVTFPVHVSGRVTEVVDHPSVCPKVVEEFVHGTRTPAWCQERCQKCHLKESTGVTKLETGT